MPNKFRLDIVLKNVDRLKQTVPTLLANETQNFFVASWKKQGWDNKGVEKWPKRQDTGPKSSGRAILVKSGKLRRAVGQSIRIKTFDKIQLVVALPYAAVHNEGYNGPRKGHTRAVFSKSRTSEFIGLRRNKAGQLKMKRKYTTIYIRTGENKFGAHTLNMPRRQFMGDSLALRTIQKKIIEKQIAKVWPA